MEGSMFRNPTVSRNFQVDCERIGWLSERFWTGHERIELWLERLEHDRERLQRLHERFASTHELLRRVYERIEFWRVLLQTLKRKVGRVVEGNGLENRKGYEEYPSGVRISYLPSFFDSKIKGRAIGCQPIACCFKFPQGCSSIGRATVSKTVGCGFESCHPCFYKNINNCLLSGLTL